MSSNAIQRYMEKVFFKKIFVHHQPHHLKYPIYSSRYPCLHPFPTRSLSLSYLYIDIIVGTFSHVSTHVYLHVTIHMAEP